MLVSVQLLSAALKKAEEMSDQYALYGIDHKQPKKRVEDLLKLCREYLKKSVEVHRLDPAIQRGSINGFFLLTRDGYEISLLSGMNECWDRFVLCKELFHVVLDEEGFRSTDVLALVEEAVVAFPTMDFKAGKAVVSELLAEVAAMEFLFPFADRLVTVQANPSPDYLAVAKKYMIPQVYVEQYLADSYMNNLGPLSRQPAPAQ